MTTLTERHPDITPDQEQMCKVYRHYDDNGNIVEELTREGDNFVDTTSIAKTIQQTQRAIERENAMLRRERNRQLVVEHTWGKDISQVPGNPQATYLVNEEYDDTDCYTDSYCKDYKEDYVL